MANPWAAPGATTCRAGATRAMRRRLGVASVLWALLRGSGCGAEPPFPGSADSLDALGREVVEAFVLGDLDALERLRLTEREHNVVVWPELPASRGDHPFPLDLAWRNIQQRNRRAIPRAAGVLRQAAPLDFDSVVCEGELRSFASFSVHTDCYTLVRSGGALYRVQLFRDVLTRNGGFKVFRYYDEDLEVVRTGGGVL